MGAPERANPVAVKQRLLWSSSEMKAIVGTLIFGVTLFYVASYASIIG